jgi:hypothetical protein
MLLSEPNCATTRARKLNTAAQIISHHIATGENVTRHLVNTAMTSAFEVSDTDGAWSQRDSFEALEQGLCHHLLHQTDWPRDPTEMLNMAGSLMARLPTHTVRSEHQIATQQFSTPLTIAALVWALAGATENDLVLEPSAGTGLLAVGAQRAGASLLLNELDPLRAALLGFNYPKSTIFHHDGAKINVHLQALCPNLILMNPPFSKSAGGQDDHFAAFRHLRAARQLIGAGGRIVAVMPDWFGPDGRNAGPFQQTIGDARLTASLRLPAGAFAKHGTSINVKLIVLDKVPDQGPVVAHDCLTLHEAIAQIAKVAPRCSYDAILKLRVPKTCEAWAGQGAQLISGLAASQRPLAPVRASRIYPKPMPVTYETLEEAAPLGEQSGIYLPYRPSRIVINDAGEHPTALVESIAMGSITAPKPRYQPLLPDICVTGRLLSAAQLETIIYAGQAHDTDLPGTFSLDAKSRALVPDAQGKTYRAGYFLGDGTGAGKGRQVAGLILDNWLKGRRKAIWISKNETLLEDARRDWSALGGIEADIHSLSQWKLGEPISLPEGRSRYVARG